MWPPRSAQVIFKTASKNNKLDSIRLCRNKSCFAGPWHKQTHKRTLRDDTFEFRNKLKSLKIRNFYHKNSTSRGIMVLRNLKLLLCSTRRFEFLHTLPVDATFSILYLENRKILLLLWFEHELRKYVCKFVLKYYMKPWWILPYLTFSNPSNN